MSVKGDSGMVGLAKEGPVYSVEWSPNGNLFAVCYGFMPSKVGQLGFFLQYMKRKNLRNWSPNGLPLQSIIKT